jgi:hypothetical protein
MPKFFKKTLILIIITAIFLAPFSGGLKINKAEAQTADSQNATVQLPDGEKVELSTPDKGIGYASAIFDLKVIKIKEVNFKYTLNTNIIYIKDNSTLTPQQEKDQTVSEESPSFFSETGKLEQDVRICYGLKSSDCTSTNNKALTSANGKVLTEDTNYKLKVKLSKSQLVGQANLLPVEGSAIYYWTFRTGNKANNTSGSVTGDVKSYNQGGGESFNCGIGGIFGGNLGGCILQVLYYLWQGTALVATLAGSFLDFFVYYSTDSASYVNTFVSQGWGAVRDIANIFFIIALLYVAIKTILGLNVTDNKRLVGAVIIIALIINFSLFTTKVVIDTSNILAKVFYNNITSTDTKGAVATGGGGEKSISVGLVDKFNPQDIVMHAYNTGLGLGYAIFIILLLMAITLYTAYIFFSVAILFAARVVSLWIAMIFSPLAFISYALPFEIPEFGHKEWWDNLLKNAFLAPIFVFMLYIIVLFAKFLTTIVQYTSDPSLSDATSTMRRLMTITIPFIILMLLLRMAKEIAVKYSGKMGEAISKAGAMVGGVALGAATGGAALLGSSTVGKHYQKVANDDNLRAQASGDKEHFAKMGITDVNVQKKMQAAAQKKLAKANYFAKSSFDVRQTGLGKGFSKVSGMDLSKGLGIDATKAEQLKGGRHAQQEREKEKGIERMKTYELTGAAASKQKESAETAKKQNERARQYKEDKEKAKKFINDNGGVFDEQDFKENYEKGENLKDRGYGLDKKVDTGSVESVKKIETVAEVNEGRRRAYSNSLQDKADIDKARGAVKTFFAEWGKGMKKMVTTPGGLATTAGLGIATGGVFVAPTIIGGGFLKALKETMKVRTTDSEVIAAIRKGENPNKDLIRELKKMTEKGHSDSGKLSDIAKKMTSEHKEEEGDNKGH